MGEPMATHIEQPLVPSFEKVLSQNSHFSEKFLGAFKKVIMNFSSLPEVATDEVKKATKEYIQTVFSNLDVKLPNIDKLTSFLIRYIDALQPIVSVCSDVKKQFPNTVLNLCYEIETEDSSEAESITLYVKGIPLTTISYEEVNNIEQKYIDYFIDSGILFTIQLDKTT